MHKTPPARLQPVPAWAIVSEGKKPELAGVYASRRVAKRECADLNLFWGPYHVVPVTVRAWAPPKQKKVTR